MIAAVLVLSAALTIVPLSPYPGPDPVDPGSPGTNPAVLFPSYVVNGDGTRWQCAPQGFSCFPDSSGLPSYLTGS